MAGLEESRNGVGEEGEEIPAGLGSLLMVDSSVVVLRLLSLYMLF